MNAARKSGEAGSGHRSFPPGFEDPTGVIFEQDASMTDGRIDYCRWTDTIFFPLTMHCDGTTLVVHDRDAFREHLQDLECMAIEMGAATIRTRILSHLRPVEEMAIISSVRDRLSADDTVLGSASMTWSVIRVGDEWKINQIHFNDDRYDLSVVAHMLRKSGET